MEKTSTSVKTMGSPLKETAHSMKVQELNYDNIPSIETSENPSEEEGCKQIRRRLICARVGKGELVHNEEEVNMERGKFPFIA